MSIIKRKAGSEDIVKSILEFDEVPTEGSPNLVESGAVAKAIGNLGKPLQWKGPATVAELNAGITGIQEGWTYTLTDSGTLTDGSIAVEAGDEVAWTGPAWFKVGGESSKIAVFHFTGTAYPNAFDIAEAIIEGKSVILIEDNNQRVYYLMSSTVYSESSLDSLKFYSFDRYNIKVLENSNGAVWDTFNISVGAVKLGSRLTDAASINVPNNALSTLNTAQSTLTLNVNVDGNEVPNFAVEITPSVDVTLTVTKTVGNTTTTLNPSVSGGNSLTTGKLYQVTCVGSCWTLAEFTVPTP